MIENPLRVWQNLYNSAEQVFRTCHPVLKTKDKSGMDVAFVPVPKE